MVFVSGVSSKQTCGQFSEILQLNQMKRKAKNTENRTQKNEQMLVVFM